jgi:hypothetical protein
MARSPEVSHQLVLGASSLFQLILVELSPGEDESELSAT